MAKYFAELSLNKGAEVGVYRGYYSRELLQANPGLNLICIDSWSLNVGHGLKKHKKALPLCLETLAPYRDRYTILKGLSVEVSRLILDESLDFVYIDADHEYEAVKADLRAWIPKVREGGMVAGHDYIEHDPSWKIDVIRAVDEYVKEHSIELHVTKASRRDSEPSWYFVKKTT